MIVDSMHEIKNLLIKIGFKKIFFISLIYISVIFSTSLHYAVIAPSETFEPASFLTQKDIDPNLKKYFPTYGKLYNHLLDEKIHPRQLTGLGDLWKSHAAAVDMAYYLLYASSADILEDNKANPGVEKTIKTFKNRQLYPRFVGYVHNLYHSIFGTIDKDFNTKIHHLVYLFVFFNITFVFFASILFFIYLIKCFEFSDTLAFIGGLLFLTLVVVTRLISFPTLDGIGLLFSVIIFYAVYTKNALPFLLFSSLGLFIKGTLIFAPFLW